MVKGLARAVRRGILVFVIDQARFYFYYGTGSPAAVGSA
jgi:hypothetical protein